MAPYGADGRFPPCHCEASSPCLPQRENSGFALPVADEAKPGFPQRSENARISVSPQRFPGTARWNGGSRRPPQGG